MRTAWIFFGALLFVALATTWAGPVNNVDENNNGEEPTGWKTYHALKEFFSPVTSYFKGLPEKTPTEIATDVKGKVTDIKDWAKENDAIQALVGALGPVKNWLKEKSNALEDKTFKEMYDDVKGRVSTLDEHIGTWLADRNTKASE